MATFGAKMDFFSSRASTFPASSATDSRATQFLPTETAMNSRELTLLSTASLFGAVASALAFRFFFFNSRKHFSRINSLSQNGAACSPPNPFDPSKRKGWVGLSFICLNFLFLIVNSDHFMVEKNRYLSWDDYFMAIAFLSAERSKDPNRQVGCYL